MSCCGAAACAACDGCADEDHLGRGACVCPLGPVFTRPADMPQEPYERWLDERFDDGKEDG